MFTFSSKLLILLIEAIEVVFLSPMNLCKFDRIPKIIELFIQVSVCEKIILPNGIGAGNEPVQQQVQYKPASQHKQRKVKGNKKCQQCKYDKNDDHRQ